MTHSKENYQQYLGNEGVKTVAGILMTLMSDSGVIQQGEIRCLSLLGCKGSIISGGVEVENGVFQTNHRVKEHKTNCKQSLVDLGTIIWKLLCSEIMSKL